MSLLLDTLISGLNSEIQSDNLRVLIQLRQLVLLQSGWLQQGEIFHDWPLRRKFNPLPPPTGILKEYLRSSPRMEELFRLWGDSDVAVQREIVRALTSILFCARSDETVAICRRILRSKAGSILDNVVLALGGVNPTHNPNDTNGDGSIHKTSVNSSIAARVASSSSSTLAASEKLTLLSAVSSHASNVTRDLLSNHEVPLRAVLKHTVTLAKRTGLSSSSSSASKKRPRSNSTDASSSSSSSSSKKSGPKIRLQRSVLLLQLSLVQSSPSDVKRQALDIRGFVRAMLLWRTAEKNTSVTVEKPNPGQSKPYGKTNAKGNESESDSDSPLKMFRIGTEAVVVTLGRDLLLTHDLSTGMKRRLFGSMVLEHLVSLSNAGHIGSTSLLQHLCVHPDTSVFDPNDVSNQENTLSAALSSSPSSSSSSISSTPTKKTKTKLSKSAMTLLSVLRTLHATTDKTRQDLVCNILERYTTLIVPYARAFPYDVENPSSTYQWLGAVVLATRIQQMSLNTSTTVIATSFTDVVPSSNKFTKSVLGKGLQSKSRLVASTTMSYMETMFNTVEQSISHNKSIGASKKRSKKNNAIAAGLQRTLPDFSVLRSLLTKKYATNATNATDGTSSTSSTVEKEDTNTTKESETKTEIEFRTQLFILMGRYLEHVPTTAQRVRYDGCTMLKKYGDISALLKNNTNMLLCDKSMLGLLSASANAGMLQWGNFLRRIQLDTKSVLQQANNTTAATNTSTVRMQCACSAYLFPTSLPVTPLRALLLTCAKEHDQNMNIRTMSRDVIAKAVVHNGGVFAPFRAHDGVASFLPQGKDMTLPIAFFFDAVLSRCSREPLEFVMSYSDECTEWGVFAVVVVDTLNMAMERYVAMSQDDSTSTKTTKTTKAKQIGSDTRQTITSSIVVMCKYVLDSLKNFSERLGKDATLFVKKVLGQNLKLVLSTTGCAIDVLKPQHINTEQIQHDLETVTNEELPSIVSRLCRSFENETKQTSKAFILQTLGLAVRRMGGRSAALGPIVTLLTAMQKVLTHSDVTVSGRDLIVNYANLLMSSDATEWVTSTNEHVKTLINICCSPGDHLKTSNYVNRANAIHIVCSRMKDEHKRHLLNTFSIDNENDVLLVIELFHRKNISNDIIDAELYCTWLVKIQNKLHTTLNGDVYVNALHQLIDSTWHQLAGMNGTDYITETTLHLLWKLSSSSASLSSSSSSSSSTSTTSISTSTSINIGVQQSEAILLRCLQSGSLVHTALSFVVLTESNTNPKQQWSFSCLLGLLRSSGSDDVPPSFVAQIVPMMQNVMAWGVQKIQQDNMAYNEASNTFVPLLQQLCLIHEKHEQRRPWESIETIIHLTELKNVDSFLKGGAAAGAAGAAGAASSKKKKKKRKRSDC